MRSVRLAFLLIFAACDGVVGELGAADSPPPVIDPGNPHIGALTCTPVTGDAPLSVTCQLEVTHPTNKPVSCSIDPGNGQPQTMVNDCLTKQMLTFPYAVPGAFTLVVLASDPDLGHTNATVNVTVTQRPNQPPSIDDFHASPTSGGAPFTTTLTWTLSDPESDTLTCKLNNVVVDCAMPAPFTLQSPGMQTVTLTVTDSYGGTVSRTVTLTAVMPVGDVRISKVEWAQSVVLTDLKLVGQKDALLRVYVLADKAGFANVKVEASGKLGTTDLGKLMLQGPPTVPTTDTASDLAQQYTVTVPGMWVEPNVEVTLKIDSTDVLPETDEANNVRVLKPLVGKANVMQLTAVPVMHQGMTPTVTNLDGPLTRIWPLKSVNAQTRTPYTYSGALTGFDGNAWGNLLDDIAQLRQMDGSSRNYYGFVKVSYGSGVAGIGYIAQEAAVGRDDSIETAQHELGHNMGREHAPCGGVAGPDPQYPYAGAKIGSWGYDAMTRRLVNPATTVDLMSYCQPEWVSDYNYKAVQRYLEAQPYIPPSGPSSPYVATVAVAGRFTRDGVVLRPVYRVQSWLPGDALPENQSSAAPLRDRAVRVQFADGRERVAAVQAHPIADLDEPMESFVTTVEDLGPIAAIEVYQHGVRLHRSLATRAVEPLPELSVVRLSDVELVVRWDASRYPLAAVAHLAGGELAAVRQVTRVRTTLALGLTGGLATVRVDGLEGGLIELSFSDGLNSTSSTLPMPAR